MHSFVRFPNSILAAVLFQAHARVVVGRNYLDRACLQAELQDSPLSGPPI